MVSYKKEERERERERDRELKTKNPEKTYFHIHINEYVSYNNLILISVNQYPLLSRMENVNVHLTHMLNV